LSTAAGAAADADQGGGGRAHLAITAKGMVAAVAGEGEGLLVCLHGTLEVILKGLREGPVT